MVQPRDGEILIREELRLGIACGPGNNGGDALNGADRTSAVLLNEQL